MLAVTDMLTVPLPFPLAPLEIVSQLVLLLTAVHVQPVSVVTFVDAVPPPEMMFVVVDDRPYVQGAAPWLSVNVWPPIVSVPVRGAGLGLAAAANTIVPSPLPLVPDVMVSHVPALVTAVHVHPFGVSTAVELLPPPAIIDWLGGINV